MVLSLAVPLCSKLQPAKCSWVLRFSSRSIRKKTHEHFNNGQTARLRSREAGAVEGGLGGGERTGRPTGDRHG
jgi:hypothetical protein